MPAFKAIQVGMCAVLIAASVAAATEGTRYKGYEMPSYTVRSTQGAIEVRDYAPHILAEVTVEGNRNRAIARGFQVLANYIFGGNADGEKIAMTVPVAQAPSGGNWTVSFMMPAAFTLDDLPKAQSDAVRFVETEPERQLVIQFSGLRTDRRIADYTEQLVTYAANQGFEIMDAPRYYFYDDPMTPPWSRRNEIAVPISG
ncbi:SOUL family heme-binding protein [Shimia ponticola]|uniref:SOUL family heme-binding protein n=1 Tax=Shimia ponticola TaxID=2582893 RepID=UPI0011BEA3FD|nr:heme-binding protein [Shimia ponticola]